MTAIIFWLVCKPSSEFAFHLHALINICEPEQLLESLQKSPLMPDISAPSLEIEFLSAPLITASQCLLWLWVGFASVLTDLGLCLCELPSTGLLICTSLIWKFCLNPHLLILHANIPLLFLFFFCQGIRLIYIFIYRLQTYPYCCQLTCIKGGKKSSKYKSVWFWE